VKPKVFISDYGDISFKYYGQYYEYDKISDRYYKLDEGTTVNSPDGKLAKRRISKAQFEEIRKALERSE
jgi:hypothetical protein